jgi:D-cysteine desulfhydrase
MERLSRELGGPKIWLKRDDLTESAASGNKLRKLEYSIGEALAQEARVLITAGGVQSNHCRAKAIMAARLGLKSHLVLRGKPPSQADGNLLLDTLAGAEITFATRDEFQNLDDQFLAIADEYRSRGDEPFIIPIGASDEIGLWGYIECARELKKDFDDQSINPGYVISAAGSGGTLGGLILGNYLHGLDTNIVAFNVCDDEAWFRAKISTDIERWQQRYESIVPKIPVNELAINIIDGYVGPGYARADRHVYDTIKRIARTEGIFFDPVYTGKAFDAMLQEYVNGRFNDTRDIVFIHTGGIYGLFPEREQFINETTAEP